MNQLTVVRFRVRYRLGEYLEVVRLHAQASPALAAAGSWRRGCCLALLSLFATGVFPSRPGSPAAAISISTWPGCDGVAGAE